MPAKFDLQKAIAGEPIQTRDGRKARFIAHVPEASRSVVVYVDGCSVVSSVYENGAFLRGAEDSSDLVMAPRKRQLWVRAYRNPNSSDVYLSQADSRAKLDIPGPWYGAAWLDDAPRLHGEYEIGDDDE